MIWIVWIICFILAYPLIKSLWIRDFGRPNGRSKIVILIISLLGPIGLIFGVIIFVVANDGKNKVLNGIGKFLDCIGRFLP